MPGIKELSIIIPVYNEASTIKQIIDKVLSLPIDLEIIIVDDNSFDATKEILHAYQNYSEIKIIHQSKNHGKGQAVRDGLAYAKGKYTVIQDADLEYNPEDLEMMFRKAKTENLPVIYGSRFKNQKKPAGMRGLYILANHFFTWLTNLLYGSRLTDEGTCYKMFQTDVIKNINLKAKGFDFCPEITAKVLKAGYKIAEVPIRYQARYVNKKVKFRDSFIIIWTLLKYYFKPNKI